jgi:hypothetical protein
MRGNEKRGKVKYEIAVKDPFNQKSKQVHAKGKPIKRTHFNAINATFRIASKQPPFTFADV